MPRWTLSLVLTACWLASPCAAQQRPLSSDDPYILPTGRMRAQFGMEFLQGERFPLSGLEGDLTRMGVAALHAGLGEYAEFQLSGVMRDFLSVKDRSLAAVPPDFAGNATSDFGDLVLGTKIKLKGDKGAAPAVSFKFAVQLPNATNESGLGRDVTDFYASLLLAKAVGRARLLGNIGLGILGSPVQANSQSDLFTYGFGVILPLKTGLNLAAEVSGRQGPQRIGNESRSTARVGIQVRAAGLRWDAGAMAGLRAYDADTGVILGVTYEFQAFHRDAGPTRVR